MAALFWDLLPPELNHPMAGRDVKHEVLCSVGHNRNTPCPQCVGLKACLHKGMLKNYYLLFRQYFITCSSIIAQPFPLQACCSTMYFLIRALTSLQNEGPGALLQGIKVLVVAHSIPRRLFPEWNVAVVPSPVTHPEDSTQSQPIEEVVAECLTFLVSAAEYVLKSTEDDSEASSDTLCTLSPELLIPAGSIGFLCKAEECESPVDFVSMYLSPVQPALDSGTLCAIWEHSGICRLCLLYRLYSELYDDCCSLLSFRSQKLYGPFPCTYLPDATCSQWSRTLMAHTHTHTQMPGFHCSPSVRRSLSQWRSCIAAHVLPIFPQCLIIN
ncbi:testis-expressed protein 47 [Coturnix japonica]|uniref:testis-expressed protein 47 n=1 Tax=Coturnix japonica TaxID=93934 RepID=UPI0013A5CF94|nr:testis-expressed protein 47 [Coturnix japonica]